MSSDRGNVMVEDAKLIFKNFAGKEDKYNRAGDRNFCVILDPETAQRMETDGWNIRWLEAREEGEENTPYLPVAVSFRNQPPKVVMITSVNRTALDEASIEVLDYADIKMVDLIVQPYHWEVSGKSGIKAYLKTMFVTIEEDELERKYAVADEEEGDLYNE